MQILPQQKVEEKEHFSTMHTTFNCLLFNSPYLPLPYTYPSLCQFEMQLESVAKKKFPHQFDMRMKKLFGNTIERCKIAASHTAAPHTHGKFNLFENTILTDTQCVCIQHCCHYICRGRLEIDFQYCRII